MAISSIGGTGSLSAFDQLSTLRPSAGAVQDPDGSKSSGPVAGAGQGKLASAIQQALAQFGISAADGSSATGTTAATATDTSGASDTSTTQDPTQALNAFAQSLFAALHAQSANAASAAGAAGASATAQSSNGVDAVAATGGGGKAHHHHGGGAGKLESGLQSLIQQLGASGADTASADGALTGATSDTTSSAATSTSGLSDLQKSFDSLLAADGASGSSSGTNLTSFLQALSQKLENAPSTGNVVNTKV